MTAPLMPKATAVWLVENTTLTFRQIAAFCELHELEIQAIADGDVAYNIIGISPVATNQLTEEEIKRCEADPAELLIANIQENNVKLRNAKNKKLLSPNQRNDKPAAILWIIKNCPEIIDSQICKLIGTTKPTIASIREGTHRDMQNLRPKNPVAVGLCNEKDLENAMAISQARLNPKPKKAKKSAKKKAVAKKVATKKNATKKTTDKKAAAKKKTAKKPVAKKVTAKKATAKKTTVKKVTKKDEGKKTVAKKASAKKTAAKKATTKKTTAKKAVAKKPVAKKTTEKKVTAKKTSAKKTVAKKTATKKPAVKKTVAKKATTKKRPVAKTATKKAATKKATPKKATAKKAVAKKKTAKK